MIHDAYTHTLIAGPQSGQAPPDVLIDVPHGATLPDHLHRARAWAADLPDHHDALFWVSTDQGAPACAHHLAQCLTHPEWVRAQADALGPRTAAYADAASKRRVALLIGHVPRTLADLNRVWSLDRHSFLQDRLTPAVGSLVRPGHETEHLHTLHNAYQQASLQRHAEVCDGGGIALHLHTCAPISVAVREGDDPYDTLQRAYANPQRHRRRPMAQLMTATHDGDPRTDPHLVARIQRRFQDAHIRLALNTPFAMHRATVLRQRADRWPGPVFGVEFNRKALSPSFTPFHPWQPTPQRLEHLLTPLALALIEHLGPS